MKSVLIRLSLVENVNKVVNIVDSFDEFISCSFKEIIFIKYGIEFLHTCVDKEVIFLSFLKLIGFCKID